MHSLHAILVNVKDFLDGVTLIPNPDNFTPQRPDAWYQGAEEANALMDQFASGVLTSQLPPLDDDSKKYVDDIEVMARQRAMMETEHYGDGNVFDWRTDEHAGRWIELVPGRGVILGAVNPLDFKEKLAEYIKYPIQSAKQALFWLENSNIAWRSKEEIDSIPGCVILDNPRNGEQARVKKAPYNKESEYEQKEGYWSGIKNPPVMLNSDMIDKFANDNTFSMDTYYLKKIADAVYGTYTFDSMFFSLPDYSTKISKATLEDAANNPQDYALVFSDYHN